MLRCHYERLERGWTQAQLGRLAGIPQTYISLLERERLIPTEKDLQSLSKVLGVFPASALMRPMAAEPLEERA